MAFSTGTATNFVDFYAKLRDFLKTGIGGGQNWTQLSGPTGTPGTDTVADQIIMQGPGTGGSDEVLIGLRPVVNVGSDYYNIEIRGLTIWNPATPSMSDQVNCSRATVLHLWDQPMKYWFIGNGRRFIVVVNVSTVYQSGYFGLILPYVLPTLWPYPLFVGGASGTTTWRWSQVDAGHSGFFDPGLNSSALLFPDVVWRDVENKQNTLGGTTDQYDQDSVITMPYRYDREALRENIDGTYPLEPVSIICRSPYEAQLGRLQSVFRTSGFGNSAESIIQLSGVDHLVVPSVYRAGWDDYCAIALE